MISLVITVKNEAKSILSLLQSITAQTKQPDEVIIVDGGSTDATPALIKNFAKTTLLNLRFYQGEYSRSRGRNLAIGRARGDIIAVTDAGCILQPQWLKEITRPIVTKKAAAVAGIYIMKTPTQFTYCSAPFVGIMSHNIRKQDFLPSSRSIAFTKKAWKLAGGYPTQAKTAAEDLVFAQSLADHPRIKMALAKQAIVEWTPSQNLKSFFRDIYHHTRGNLEAGYVRHLRKNALVAIRYALALPLILAAIVSGNTWLLVISVIGVFAYLFYPSFKFIHFVRSPLDVIYFSVLQITADMAVLSALFKLIQ